MSPGSGQDPSSELLQCLELCVSLGTLRHNYLLLWLCLPASEPLEHRDCVSFLFPNAGAGGTQHRSAFRRLL